MTCKSQGHPFAVISLRSSPLLPSVAGDTDPQGYPTPARYALSAPSQTHTVCVSSPGTGTPHAGRARGRETERSGTIGDSVDGALVDDEEESSRDGEQRVVDEGVLCRLVNP